MNVFAPRPLTYIFLFRLFVLFGRYFALSSALFLLPPFVDAEFGTIWARIAASAWRPGSMKGSCHYQCDATTFAFGMEFDTHLCFSVLLIPWAFVSFFCFFTSYFGMRLPSTKIG